jgi:hypothetical protein
MLMASLQISRHLYESSPVGGGKGEGPGGEAYYTHVCEVIQRNPQMLLENGERRRVVA